MRGTRIRKAVGGDDGARAELVAAIIATGDEDAALSLIEGLIAAARADCVSDVLVELRADRFDDAAEMIQANL